MRYDEFLTLPGQFGLAMLVGLVLGLEREMRHGDSDTAGLREFVLAALVGAFCAYLAAHYSAPWFIALGFVGLLGILLTSYWKNRPSSRGITTELAAMMTFFLGVLILSGARELAIALAIATLGVLFPKAAIKQWRSTVIPQGPTGKPPP